MEVLIIFVSKMSFPHAYSVLVEISYINVTDKECIILIFFEFFISSCFL